MMPSKSFKDLKVSDLGEKRLIKRLLERSQKSQPTSLFLEKFLDENSVKSTKDDAALIDLGENYLVATSDLLMQSAHFPDEMTPFQMGKKVVTVNVSDIAAMGADTICIIVSMGLPKDMSLSNFDEMIEGILESCKQYDMVLIGGDTNESADLTLCGTCIGMVKKENVLMKGGARSSDVVAVTGKLGLAAAGFELLFCDESEESKLEGLDHGFMSLALEHALQPEARLKEGILLGKTGVVTSATDITDGLLSEIGEIIDASPENIGITFYEEQVPIPHEVHEIGNILGKNPLEMALTYGEDFELLLTVQKDKFDDLNHLKNVVDLHEIGFVDSSGIIKMIDKDGKTNVVTPKGYEHLK